MKLSLHLWLLFAAGLAGAATPEELALAPYQPPAATYAKSWPRERVLGFMHELADFVEKNHVVTDPARKTYGMVYEFWKDGKKMQEFGLDAMHDGAWFMSALVTAHRADPAGGWLARAQKYQVPFYANLLNHSDALFPKMQPTDEDKHGWAGPVKGWAPRGWDDGSGFDRKNGQALPNGYFTGSNHLAQDLADALMNVWLTTRDPEVAEALGHLRDYKAQCFGGIQGIEIAAAVSAGQADAFLKYKLPDFSPQALAPYYTGLFEKKAHRLASYDDGLAWLYRQGTAAAWLTGEMPRGFASYAIARCYGSFAAMETFFDDRPYECGAWFFDLQRGPGFVEGKGRLEEYASTSKNFYGPRGVEIAWVAAAMLPELKATPALWDGAWRRGALTGTITRMVDEPPETDGVKDAVYAKSVAIGEDSARVTLVSDPRNLHIFIETTHPELTVTFQEEFGEWHAPRTVAAVTGDLRSDATRRLSKKTSAKSTDASDKPKKKKTKSTADDAKPSAKTKAVAKDKVAATAPEHTFTRGGKLTVTREGQCTATNEKGERLLAVSSSKPAGFQQGEGDGWTIEVRMPYTFVPAQNAWINGVDFGRYRVGIENAAPVTVCLLSEPARIQQRLENGVLGTIEFWHKVWKESGMIPSGWHSPSVKAGQWEISDAGGYAHLINALALWLIYQDGKREWEIIREQFPDTPKPAPPLPASVRKAQGIGNDQ